MTKRTTRFRIDVGHPAFWMTLCAVLAIWLGVELGGLAHRVARARQLLGRIGSSAGPGSEVQVVVDLLVSASSAAMRSAAGLVGGGIVAVIVTACFDWAPKLVRIAIACGILLILLLLFLTQSIS